MASKTIKKIIKGKAKSKGRSKAKKPKKVEEVEELDENLELEDDFDDADFDEAVLDDFDNVDLSDDDSDADFDEDESEEEEDYEEEDGDDEDFDFESDDSPKGGKLKMVFLGLIIGILIGGGLMFYYNQQQNNSIQENENQEQQALSSRPVAQKVAELLRYQAADEPLQQPIKDISLIGDLPIYQFAQNGDTVLVYKDMTVIYDESRDKIVAVVPQNLLKASTALGGESDVVEGQDGQATDEPTTSDTDETVSAISPEDVSVEVRNGTKTAGLAGKTSTQLKDSLGYDILAANANKNSYTEGIIIDLSDGELAIEVEAIRKELEITKVLSEMPSGEADSTADIVVILGE